MNLEFITLLPDDIINYIWKFVNSRYKIFISKKNYELYHNLIDELIPDNRIESYIREIIRKDCIYSFEKIYYRNYKHWLLMTNYPYSKEYIFDNYLSFIKFYSQKNNSNKCLEFINQKFKTPNQKLHKSKFTKNIKWIN